MTVNNGAPGGKMSKYTRLSKKSLEFQTNNNCFQNFDARRNWTHHDTDF